MPYLYKTGTRTRDRYEIQGWNINTQPSAVGQKQPFDLGVYGSYDPSMSTFEILEAIVDYLDDELFQLRSRQ